MYEIFLDLLNSRGLKVADVVRATGINHSVFSDWKNGKSVPKADKLKKVADFFGVSLDYLQTGEVKTGYYFTNEMAQMAQELMQNKELRLLFTEARGASAEDIKTTYDMLLALKRKERHEDD